MNAKERLAAREMQAKTGAVHGWAFKELSVEENDEIVAFLDGGPCPESYKNLYALCREQLGLPKLEEK